MMLIPFSALLLVGSFLLIKSTSPMSHGGSLAPEQAKVRTLLAKMLFFAGLVVMSLAIVAACLMR
jgi:hypothetical protein